MDKMTLAYLAGVTDSDGCIGIKKSTYAMRVRGDAGQPVYSERITLKQVEPQAVALAHQTFGGYRGMTDPSAKRGRPLHAWHLHSLSAGKAIKILLPFLRIKKVQAENALALRSLIGTGRKWPVPEIDPNEPMVTATEFAVLVGMSASTILQATAYGSIPSRRIGQSRLVPLSFLEIYKTRMLRGGHPPRSEAVTQAMERLYQRAKELNHVGI